MQDIWPASDDIETAFALGYRVENIPKAFASAWNNPCWQQIEAPKAARFPWDQRSRYLRRPKFAALEKCRLGTYSARPLMVLGDNITSDHISPAGWIDPLSKAGQWLIEQSGDPADLNVYAAYRGNWEVMLRGLFTNRLARNYLHKGLEPAETLLADGTILPIFAATDTLAAQGQAAVILAGERYGTGSSRDWAAKGVALLHVRAVIARSFERIHRSNLIGMGILPVEIRTNFDPKNARISAADEFELDVPAQQLTARQDMVLTWRPVHSGEREIQCRAAVETSQEVEILRKGGVLSAILQNNLQI